MGKYRRPRIMFICDDEVKEELEKRAENERRSVSSLVENLVIDGLHSTSDSVPETKRTPNTEALLESLLSDALLDNAEIAELSQQYKISKSVLIRLRDRLFPQGENAKQQDKESQTKSSKSKI